MDKMQLRITPSTRKGGEVKVVLRAQINNVWKQAIGMGAYWQDAYAAAWNKLYPDDLITPADLGVPDEGL